MENIDLNIVIDNLSISFFHLEFAIPSDMPSRVSAF